jgi:hypothetical protein
MTGGEDFLKKEVVDTIENKQEQSKLLNCGRKILLQDSTTTMNFLQKFAD